MFQLPGFFRVEERERRFQEQGDQFGGEKRPHQRRSQEQSHLVGGEEQGQFEALSRREAKQYAESN